MNQKGNNMKKEKDAAPEMEEYELKANMETLMKAAEIKKDKKLMKKLKKHHKDKSASIEIEFEGVEDDEDEEPTSIDGIREKANKKAMKKYEE